MLVVTHEMGFAREVATQVTNASRRTKLLMTVGIGASIAGFLTVSHLFHVPDCAGFGGSLILLSFSHSFLASLPVMALFGFTMVTLLDASNTLVQRIVPDALRGRVMAIWTMMLTGLAPFGSLLVGELAQHFSARRTFAAGGMACIMGAMAFGFTLPVLQREARKLIRDRSRTAQSLVIGDTAAKR